MARQREGELQVVWPERHSAVDSDTFVSECVHTHWPCADFQLVTSMDISCMSCCGFIVSWGFVFVLL